MPCCCQTRADQELRLFSPQAFDSEDCAEVVVDDFDAVPSGAQDDSDSGTSSAATTRSFRRRRCRRHSDSQRRPAAGVFSSSATDLLHNWLEAHFDDPYPSVTEKEQMAKQTGLTYGQISHWFISELINNPPPSPRMRLFWGFGDARSAHRSFGVLPPTATHERQLQQTHGCASGALGSVPSSSPILSGTGSWSPLSAGSARQVQPSHNPAANARPVVVAEPCCRFLLKSIHSLFYHIRIPVTDNLKKKTILLSLCLIFFSFYSFFLFLGGEGGVLY